MQGTEGANNNNNESNHQQVIKPTFKNGLTTIAAPPNTVYQWHTLLPIISATPVRPQNARLLATGNGNEGHGANGSSNGGHAVAHQQRANGGHNGHVMNELSPHQSQMAHQNSAATTVINNMRMQQQQQQQHLMNVQQQQQKMVHMKQPPTPPPEPNHPNEAEEGMLEEEAIDDDVFETPEVPTQSSKGNNVHKSGPRTTNSSVHDQLEATAAAEAAANQQTTTVKRRTQSCSAVQMGNKEPQSPLKVSE